MEQSNIDKVDYFMHCLGIICIGVVIGITVSYVMGTILDGKYNKPVASKSNALTGSLTIEPIHKEDYGTIN